MDHLYVIAYAIGFILAFNGVLLLVLVINGERKLRNDRKRWIAERKAMNARAAFVRELNKTPHQRRNDETVEIAKFWESDPEFFSVIKGYHAADYRR